MDFLNLFNVWNFINKMKVYVWIGIFLFVIFNPKMTHAVNSCTFEHFPYFKSTLKVENDVVVTFIDSNPNRIDFINSFKPEVVSNFISDKLVAVSLVDQKIRGSSLLEFIRENNIQHVELKNCIIDDVEILFTSYFFENVLFLGLFSTEVFLDTAMVPRNDMTIKLHGNFQSTQSYSFVFRSRVLIFEEFENINREVIENMLKSSLYCISFYNCDLTHVEREVFSQKSNTIDFIGLSSCRANIFPYFLSNTAHKLMIDINYTFVKIPEGQKFSNVNNLFLVGIKFCGKKERQKLKNAFPNAEIAMACKDY